MEILTTEMRLRRKFNDFHRDNPKVYERFQEFAFKTIERGHKHYSAHAIFEILRWHTNIDTASEDHYKINSNLAPYYSRMFHSDHPAHNGFFRTRELRSEVEVTL